MDRGGDWAEAVAAVCQWQQLGEEEAKRVKASLIMKPVKSATPFRKAADEVQASICGLRAFVDANKRDYVAAAGRFTAQQKDKIEEEVLQVVSACRARIDQLTDSIVTAQQQRGAGGGGLVNEHTAAHLHGVVLVLVELLQSVCEGFDRCRSVRNAQQIADDMRQQQRRATHYAAAPSNRPAFGGGGFAGGGGEAQSWQQQQQQAAGGSGGGKQQQQQQVVADQEMQQLLEDLTRRTAQAQHVERTVREIAAMQHMISTAVMQQAEAIEQLYNSAVDATFHVRRGNEELRKTIAVNKSGTLYIVVMLLTASAMLLLFDWINS
ncbi:syntaxin [Raphidocelis subcapitata]|uniref:Syntaxin n=1 Tax=Raphidocelis subcapitata TaxID=307507 RepID=A0A2V0NK43_9CHLO|nr:syntaxin [Raphidocelis subcapitata]|eukprot:GBF87646.1 syntaxin [Raphidocelis subcapitata]